METFSEFEDVFSKVMLLLENGPLPLTDPQLLKIIQDLSSDLMNKAQYHGGIFNIILKSPKIYKFQDKIYIRKTNKFKEINLDQSFEETFSSINLDFKNINNDKECKNQIVKSKESCVFLDYNFKEDDCISLINNQNYNILQDNCDITLRSIDKFSELNYGQNITTVLCDNSKDILCKKFKSAEKIENYNFKFDEIIKEIILLGWNDENEKAFQKLINDDIYEHKNQILSYSPINLLQTPLKINNFLKNQYSEIIKWFKKGKYNYGRLKMNIPLFNLDNFMPTCYYIDSYFEIKDELQLRPYFDLRYTRQVKNLESNLSLNSKKLLRLLSRSKINHYKEGSFLEYKDSPNDDKKLDTKYNEAEKCKIYEAEINKTYYGKTNASTQTNCCIGVMCDECENKEKDAIKMKKQINKLKKELSDKEKSLSSLNDELVISNYLKNKLFKDYSDLHSDFMSEILSREKIIGKFNELEKEYNKFKNIYEQQNIFLNTWLKRDYEMDKHTLNTLYKNLQLSHIFINENLKSITREYQENRNIMELLKTQVFQILLDVVPYHPNLTLENLKDNFFNYWSIGNLSPLYCKCPIGFCTCLDHDSKCFSQSLITKRQHLLLNVDVKREVVKDGSFASDYYPVYVKKTLDFMHEKKENKSSAVNKKSQPKTKLNFVDHYNKYTTGNFKKQHFEKSKKINSQENSQKLVLSNQKELCHVQGNVFARNDAINSSIYMDKSFQEENWDLYLTDSDLTSKDLLSVNTNKLVENAKENLDLYFNDYALCSNTKIIIDQTEQDLENWDDCDLTSHVELNKIIQKENFDSMFKENLIKYEQKSDVKCTKMPSFKSVVLAICAAMYLGKFKRNFKDSLPDFKSDFGVENKNEVQSFNEGWWILDQDTTLFQVSDKNCEVNSWSNKLKTDKRDIIKPPVLKFNDGVVKNSLDTWTAEDLFSPVEDSSWNDLNYFSFDRIRDSFSTQPKNYKNEFSTLEKNINGLSEFNADGRNWKQITSNKASRRSKSECRLSIPDLKTFRNRTSSEGAAACEAIVLNIPLEITRRTLKKKLSSFGTLKALEFYPEVGGFKHKRAYVLFENAEDCNKALEKEEIQIGNGKIKIIDIASFQTREVMLRNSRYSKSNEKKNESKNKSFSKEKKKESILFDYRMKNVNSNVEKHDSLSNTCEERGTPITPITSKWRQIDTISGHEDYHSFDGDGNLAVEHHHPFDGDRNKSFKSKSLQILLANLKNIFPAVPKTELIQSVFDVRQKNNSTLSGINLSHLTKEIFEDRLNKTATDEGQSCLLCDNLYGNVETVVLVCFHTFHKLCLEGWKTHHSSCPKCGIVLQSLCS